MLGVPMELGAGRRGADMGPAAIRHADLVNRLEAMGKIVEDRGNIHVLVGMNTANKNMRYREEILTVCQTLAAEVYQIYKEDSFPLILGGDHSIAIGSIAGLAYDKPKMGVLWVDAHGDFNTPESSPTGNVHGMPLAINCGIGDEDFIHIQRPGRKIDPKRGGLTYREAHFIMKYISTYGPLITSLEVVEVNPILDFQNKTGELAVELIESFFGKRIMYSSEIDELI
ncbi:arginase [uncultured Veillonella sp.]|uniref:arginase n=2 Tax=Veillonella TaxID=29465 RepID=UPI0025942B80|nr:arginase [uncultured Veillonella sp.]